MNCYVEIREVATGWNTIFKNYNIGFTGQTIQFYIYFIQLVYQW